MTLRSAAPRSCDLHAAQRNELLAAHTQLDRRAHQHTGGPFRSSHKINSLSSSACEPGSCLILNYHDHMQLGCVQRCCGTAHMRPPLQLRRERFPAR